MRHIPAFGIMNKFMAEHGCIRRRIAKRREGRHLHMVAPRRVEGLATAVPYHGVGVGAKVLGLCNTLMAFLNWRHGGVITIRQAVDLSDVEHRVGF